jgi:hypothetical protein
MVSMEVTMDVKDWAVLQRDLLRSQLKVIREYLREGEAAEGADRRVGPRSMSQMSMIRDILQEAGAPLHLSDILGRVETRFGVKLDRESVVSALTKKVRKGVLFTRVGPNTFGLK